MTDKDNTLYRLAMEELTDNDDDLSRWAIHYEAEKEAKDDQKGRAYHEDLLPAIQTHLLASINATLNRATLVQAETADRTLATLDRIATALEQQQTGITLVSDSLRGPVTRFEHTSSGVIVEVNGESAQDVTGVLLDSVQGRSAFLVKGQVTDWMPDAEAAQWIVN